jgi:pimeloyl-ACP methyl ester carboxylesterase
MMDILVNGVSTYCYTGGKAFERAKPTVVFVHGVLSDHSVWILQSRYLAHHGLNVLAVDLPGHARSEGEAPESVEQAADFIVALLDVLCVERAALVGHSWGSLIALQAAAQLAERVSHLVLVGTAYPMKVSQVLLDAAQNDPEKGIAMINVFSRSTLAPPPSSLGPGTWVLGAMRALNRRVLKSNSAVNVFYRGFMACNNYANGEQAIASVSCPILFVLGLQDQMTQWRSAQTLVAQAQAHNPSVRVVSLPVGHHQMTEAPEATLMALRDFLV